MSTVPKITLASLAGMSRFAPLVALGAIYQQSDLFAPIRSRLQFPEQMHTDRPYDALLTLLVSMLAGCRSVSQINTAIRPDPVLARAWGQEHFAEQSTIARVLDQCREAQISQLQAGVEAIFRWISQTAQHDWNQPLWVDIDLTALPTSARAEGSTKGYFSEKKGSTAANSAGLERRNTMKVSVRCSIQAILTPTKPSSRRFGSLKLRYACHHKPVRKCAYASMPGLGRMTTWPGPYGRAISCVPRVLAANGPIWSASRLLRRNG
jgi:hypothetical protein